MDNSKLAAIIINNERVYNLKFLVRNKGACYIDNDHIVCKFCPLNEGPNAKCMYPGNLWEQREEKYRKALEILIRNIGKDGIMEAFI